MKKQNAGIDHFAAKENVNFSLLISQYVGRNATQWIMNRTGKYCTYAHTQHTIPQVRNQRMIFFIFTSVS